MKQDGREALIGGRMVVDQRERERSGESTRKESCKRSINLWDKQLAEV